MPLPVIRRSFSLHDVVHIKSESEAVAIVSPLI